jgi:hypothetical protein
MLRGYKIENAARTAGFTDTKTAEAVIRWMVELKTNECIVCRLIEEHGFARSKSSIVRKFTQLLRYFIIYNFPSEFADFCSINRVNIFNDYLEFEKSSAVYARFVFIIFLREKLLVRTENRIF